MGLVPVFIGFSSTDSRYYNLMKAWKENDNINFSFRDCQLQNALNSDNEQYIKRCCRERISMASTFVQLIGADTRYKYRYVRWEAEVALEKGCRIICVNIDNSRYMNTETCPPILRDCGAIFVPFSPQIVMYAIKYNVQEKDGWYYYKDSVYNGLGY